MNVIKEQILKAAEEKLSSETLKLLSNLSPKDYIKFLEVGEYLAEEYNLILQWILCKADDIFKDRK